MNTFSAFGMPITELAFTALGVIAGIAGLWLEVNFISGVARWMFHRGHPRQNLSASDPTRSRRFGRWVREHFLPG